MPPRTDPLPRFAAPFLRHPRIEPMISTLLRARLLRTPVRFVVRELGGRPTVATYRLRESDAAVALEHGSPDIEAFDEIFYQGIYAPPDQVVAALAGLDRLRVLDIGANVGLFGAFAGARWPGARIEAYEPDPRNVAVQRRTVAANPGITWHLHPVAAAVHTGTLSFRTGRYALSGPATEDDRDASQVEAVDVLPALGEVDLLKIDAEGSEWAILDDPRFLDTSARAVALEFHPDLCPEPDARLAAHRRLGAAGFSVADVATRAPTGYGSLWAWR